MGMIPLPHCFSAGVDDKVQSSLAPQLWGNQPVQGALPTLHAEVENTQIGKFIDRCPLILRE